MEEINENYNQDQAAAAAAAAAAALSAVTENAPQEANAPESGNGGLLPVPGTSSTKPKVIDGSSSSSISSPEEKAKAALSEPIERAIAETCAKWDA